MELSPTVETALFVGILGLLILLAASRPRAFLMVGGALLPLTVPRLTMGIGVEWYKVIGPLAVSMTIARRHRAPAARDMRKWGRVLAYATALTGIWMVFEYSVLQRYRVAELLDLGAGQAYWKMPVQLGTFLAQGALIFAVPLWARNRGDAIAAVIGFASGCALSTGFGVLLYVATGSGTFSPLGDRAIVDVNGTDLSRIGGLSSEPKVLGACVVMLVAWILSMQLFGDAATAKRARWWQLAACGALFATFSTSSWVGFCSMMVVATVLAFTGGGRRSVLVAGLIAFVVAGFTSPAVSSVFESRFVARLSGETGEVEKQKDNYVLDAMSDNPEHAIWGFGLGGGDLAAMPYVSWEEAIYKRTPTPGSVGVRLFGDLGFIGIFLMGGTIWGWSRKLFREGQKVPGAFLALGMGGIVFISMVALSGYFFLVGAAMALAHFDRAATGPERAPLPARKQVTPLIRSLRAS